MLDKKGASDYERNARLTLDIDISKKIFDLAFLLSNEKWKHKKFKIY
jgi:hypothetical protein